MLAVNRVATSPQHAVTDVVTHGVVDLLETVEVHEHDGDQPADGPLGQRVLEVAVKEVTVRQTGQAVMERLVLPGGDLAAKPVEQPATPDGHPAVGSQHLEEAQVLGIEGDRSLAVPDDDHARGGHHRS